MGEAWFGIVGVVVGAILGGAAQVIHVRVQARLDLARALRAERRDAYADFMRSLYHLLEAWSRNFESPTTDPDRLKVLDALAPQFNASLSLLELVAPQDTYGEARRLAMTVIEWWRTGAIPTYERDAPDLEEAASFVRLAKRDIGIYA